MTERSEPAPKETMRRAYEGEKPPPRDINEIMMGGETQKMREETVGTSEP